MSFKAATPLITKLSKFTNLTKFTIFRYLGHSYTTTKQTTKRVVCSASVGIPGFEPWA